MPAHTTRRSFLAAGVSAAVPILAGGPAAAGASSTVRTQTVYVGTWKGTQLHALRFDPRHGSLDYADEAAAISANWVSTHPHWPVLYVGGGEDGGVVRAFRVDRRTGGLTQTALTTTDAGGTAGGGIGCLAVDAVSDTLLVANFEAGLAASLPIGPGGSLGAPVSEVADSGSGPSPRQQGPHCHDVTVDPAGRSVLVTDFGADRVFIRAFDRATQALTTRDDGDGTAYAAPPGSGPRRLLFHPRLRVAYLLGELSADVSVLEWDARRGRLLHRQTVALDTPGFSGTKSGAELAISDDGRFLYSSSRGENTLVVFAIDQRTGRIAVRQRIACGGTTPWAFAIHPSRRWMLVANEASSSVNIFAIQPRTGILTDTGRSASVPSPGCLAYAREGAWRA